MLIFQLDYKLFENYTSIDHAEFSIPLNLSARDLKIRVRVQWNLLIAMVVLEVVQDKQEARKHKLKFDDVDDARHAEHGVAH